MTKEKFDLNWVISVDDHIIEPPHIWTDRVAAKYYREQAPHVVSDDSGEHWQFEDKSIPTVGLSAAAGQSDEELTPSPTTYAQMRPGCYDPHERINDMNRGGILASVCFPSLPRFCGQLFYEANDRELGLVCLKAYNDWILEEWCGAAPDRFIPLIVIPLWDPFEAGAEIERCAARGARALAFSENPARLGLPTIFDTSRYWDPVFSAAAEADLVLCTHIGSSGSAKSTRHNRNTLPPLVIKSWSEGAFSARTMVDWLFSGLFEQYPRLKLALSEGGIGWMPYFLQACEYNVRRHRHWAKRSNLNFGTGSLRQDEAGYQEIDLDSLNIRKLFAEHIFGCFIDDLVGIGAIDQIGFDNVMIEADYPHSDSMWPHCVEDARRQLEGLSEEVTYKVIRGNAERVFGFTPADPATITR